MRLDYDELIGSGRDETALHFIPVGSRDRTVYRPEH
jgi:hypothetical protein